MIKTLSGIILFVGLYITSLAYKRYFNDGPT